MNNDVENARMVMATALKKFSNMNFNHYLYAMAIEKELQYLVSEGFMNELDRKEVTEEVAELFDDIINALVDAHVTEALEKDHEINKCLGTLEELIEVHNLKATR